MIPSDFVDSLLERIDIVDVIGEYVTLKKSGQNYLACCPFHKEKTPSFTVSPSKQFFHCFGCGQGGSAISFLMEYAHLSFPEAVEQLAHRAGISVPKVNDNHETFLQREARKQRKQSLEETLAECATFFVRQLKTFSYAQKYLDNRGLNAETIERYQLGYAADDFHNLQQIFTDYPNEKLVTSGMVIEKDGKYYDRFRHRIMFPIRDMQGKVIAFGGRILDPKGQAKYLNSPETPLFNKSRTLYGLYEAKAALRQEKQVLVVEGYMDVVALSQYGVQYAVATLGTATTSEHVKILFREVDTIYFCFDGDDAGKKAAWRALENSLSQLQDGKSIFFLFLPDEHDPDSYVREYGAEYFSGSLKKDAIALSEYWIQELTKNIHNSNISEERRADIIKMASQHIEQISDKAKTLKYLLTKKLADKIGIDIVDLEYLVGKTIDSASKTTKTSYKHINLPKTTFRQPETVSLVERQIIWLLTEPTWAKYVELPEYLILPELYSLLLELASFIKKHEITDMGYLIECLQEYHHKEQLMTIWSKGENIREDMAEREINQEENFKVGMERLVSNIRNLQIKEILEKAKFQELNESEKNLLNKLLRKK